MDGPRIIRVLEALVREGVAFKVVGAVALNLVGLPRATQDLDIFVAPTSANVARLRAALRAVYDDPDIDEITVDDLSGRYPVIQYVPPDGRFPIDILVRLGDAFVFDDIETEMRHVGGLEVPVATPAMLYRMKRDSVRPQDRADAQRLVARFGLGED